MRAFHWMAVGFTGTVDPESWLVWGQTTNRPVPSRALFLQFHPEDREGARALREIEWSE